MKVRADELRVMVLVIEERNNVNGTRTQVDTPSEREQRIDPRLRTK